MHDGSVASTNAQIEQSMSDVVSDDMIENETKADFYVVEPLSADASPDNLRSLLEDALDTLSYHCRIFHTLPADEDKSLELLQAAYAEDAAIVLPLKHCACSGCSWCGDDAKSQAVHIVGNHYDLLEEGMEAYKQ